MFYSLYILITENCVAAGDEIWCYQIRIHYSSCFPLQLREKARRCCITTGSGFILTSWCFLTLLMVLYWKDFKCNYEKLLKKIVSLFITKTLMTFWNKWWFLSCECWYDCVRLLYRHRMYILASWFNSLFFFFRKITLVKLLSDRFLKHKLELSRFSCCLQHQFLVSNISKKIWPVID